MTMAKRHYRARRVEAHDGRMPEEVRAWFAGECSVPWPVLLEPDRRRVPEWWAAWLREHPGATPPADAIPGQFEDAAGRGLGTPG
jgi:hypothetical protein